MTVKTPTEFLALELSHIKDAEQQESELLRKMAGEADGQSGPGPERVAKQAGEEQIARAMEKAVDDGYRYDREMTELAEGRVNPGRCRPPPGNPRTGPTRTKSAEALPARRVAAGGRPFRRQRFGRRLLGPDVTGIPGRGWQIHHHTHKYMERKGE